MNGHVVRLALRVVRARLRRDRNGLGVLLIRIKLLGAACFFYFLADLCARRPNAAFGKLHRNSGSCSGRISWPGIAVGRRRRRNL